MLENVPRVPTFFPPQNGQLARLQQALTLVAVAMALGLAWWIWPHSKLGAALAATALLFAYAPVMAFELMLVAAFHGRDPAPRPT